MAVAFVPGLVAGWLGRKLFWETRVLEKLKSGHAAEVKTLQNKLNTVVEAEQVLVDKLKKTNGRQMTVGLTAGAVGLGVGYLLSGSSEKPKTNIKGAEHQQMVEDSAKPLGR
jgi:uncharacterized protein YlxW (UPF0749 family)